MYWEIAGAAGEPLVLVHGSWGNHHNWDAVAPPFSQSFRVLTYDRRGHSQSERLPEPGSVAEDASDLAALIESLEIAPAHVVGNSFGASIVLRAASEKPDLFRTLAVHEPPLFDLLATHAESLDALRVLQQRVAAVLERLQAGDTPGGARQFVETIALGPGAWDALPAEMRQTFIVNAPTWLDELQDPDWARLDLASLRGFPHRALLTRGDQSPPFFPAVMEQLAAALPRAERFVFRGDGHVPHLSHPEVYVEMITRFVTG